MIPLRLALRNFMCYRDNIPPLELAGYPVVCFSGDNGHGKSALLEAMTWALWGETRSKSDDELIHLGQREMEVQLDFAVGEERFRVIRKHSRSRPDPVNPRRSISGQTFLELQQATGDGFKPITGNSLRETEQRLREILGMDYETFINSAFLLQGRADEFTLKPPGERKKILAEILGLSLYDQWEERARALSREREGQAQELARQVAQMEEELEQKLSLEGQLTDIRLALEQVNGQVKNQEEALAALRDRRSQLESKKGQLEEVTQRLQRSRKEWEIAEGEVRQHRENIARYQQLLSQQEDIEASHAQLLEAQRETEAWNQKLSQLLPLMTQRGHLQQQLERVRGQLQTHEAQLLGQVEERQKKVSQLAHWEAELTGCLAQETELDKMEEALEKERQHHDLLSQEWQRLKAANQQLREEMQALRDKIDLLAQGDLTQCPLCGQALGSGERESIEAHYHSEGLTRKEAYQANEKALRGLLEEREAMKKQIAVAEERARRERPLVKAKMLVLEKDIQEGRKASEEIDALKDGLALIKERLSRGDFASEEKRELTGLEAQIAALAYDQEKHEMVRHRLQRLESYQPLKQQLDEALKALRLEETALQRAERAGEGCRRLIEEDSRQTASLEEEIALLPQIEGELEAGQRSREALNQRGGDLHRALGAVEQSLEHLSRQEKLRGEKIAEQGIRLKEKNIYAELAVAFSKRGIQALIIESVLPELEMEANRLLGRMTENGMHIKLETQRETRRGETTETLDIKIADDLGTRSYELYSGGEAFRINFALRVGLAKLLARRAGAPLPTLIIDEGFGTQDDTGIEKLVEAINFIQEDFQCIVVITHISQLKDAFPVRIQVTKTEEGSTFAMV
ncbi:MAG: SMC family ATPase [Chloroflexi bacterium]|nr:SMC family ATPase [Chloroflexota bacterium]